MIIEIIESSSKGNCYILRGDKEVLLLEAGISIKSIQKALDFKLDNVIAGIISHSHQDHSKSILQLSKLGVNIYLSQGTKEELKVEGHRIKVIKSEKQIQFGEWVILPFETIHDTLEPLGFLIRHLPSNNKILFATDTAYIKYRFNDISCILVECNYLKEILERNVMDGVVHEAVAARTQKTHFELSNVKKFLEINKSEKLKEVVLLHLSSLNSDPEQFIEELSKVADARIQIAVPSLKIEL